MKTLLKALLIAGLFLCQCFAQQQLPGAKKVDVTICEGYAPTGTQPQFSIPGQATLADCAAGSRARYAGARLNELNKGKECPSKQVGSSGGAILVQDYQGDPCQLSGTPYYVPIPYRFIRYDIDYVCPPDGPAWTAYTKPVVGEGGTKLCEIPIPPLSCSGLQGLSVNSGDRMVADKGAYTKENPPSCATRCALDANGQKQCGSCKVVAKTWIYEGGTTKDTWSPMIGTFTGATCADSETTTPPPEPPKCWQTKNNLNMCQQDPNEKCVTINGVQQCQAGCGYINGDFFCADKPATEPPKTPDPDKPLPDVNDNITNPEKPIDQMVKGDFKDVQKGVETRLAVVSAGIGNLENSVDTSNQLLAEIESNTEGALAAQQTQIGLLGDIKESLSGNGECDPATDPNCTPPPCDPAKDNCDDFDTGAPKSWWNSKYPDGLQTLFANKKASFMASDAYQAMTGDGITDSGGGATQWQICLPFGFADYGCHTLEISPAIWAFIRACILFGAAILCRRMLIGA